jgi:hypothetical protein
MGCLWRNVGESGCGVFVLLIDRKWKSMLGFGHRQEAWVAHVLAGGGSKVAAVNGVGPADENIT